MKTLPQAKYHPMNAGRYIAYCLTIITVLGTFQQPPISDSAQAAGNPIAEEMRTFSQEIISAYEKRDTVRLKSLYAKQPDALFFWERKMSYSWSNIDATIDGLVTALSRLRLTMNEFRSGGSGKTGWFAATFQAERVTTEGKEFTSEGRWTVIAEKIGGRWMIVHEHTSFPLPEH